MLAIVILIGLVVDILASIFITGKRGQEAMGVIIFCVLLLNVAIQICGGSDKWCE